MTQNKLIVALLVVLIAVVVTAQRPQSPPYSVSMDERVARLEQKVTELEKKVEALERNPVATQFDSHGTPEMWYVDEKGIKHRAVSAAEEMARRRANREAFAAEELAAREAEITGVMTEKGFDREKAIRYIEFIKKQAAIKEGKRDDRRPALNALPRPVDATLRPPARGGR